MLFHFEAGILQFNFAKVYVSKLMSNLKNIAYKKWQNELPILTITLKLVIYQFS